jgi:hypothetical protein
MSSENPLTDSPRRLGLMVAFSAAGVLSGILTTGSLAFLDPFDPFVGAIFGASFAVCLSLQKPAQSAGRIIAWIASSVMAYFVAIWSPVWITFFLRSVRILGQSDGPNAFSPTMFSLAGFVGAFVIMLGMFFLFSQTEGWRVPAKAFLYSLPGALLGWVSFAVSEPVGGLALGGLEYLHVQHAVGLNAEHFCSAYLIWQTGMGLVIAAALPHTAMGLSRSGQPVPLTPSQMRLSAGGKVFVFLALAGTAFLGFISARNHYRARHFQHMTEERLAQAPSADNLPEVKLRPIGQALIVKEIAGYAASETTVARIPAQKEYQGTGSGHTSRTTAAKVLYSIHYQKSASTTGSMPGVTVQISEYPNAAWAKYQLKDVPFRDADILYSGNIKTVTKFGHSVLINAMQGGHGSYVYWPSANNVVVLHYSGEEDDEFVKQYLAKYPSSL